MDTERIEARKLTNQAASKQQIEIRAELESRVEALDGAAAKSLVIRIGKSLPDLQSLLDAQYSDDVEADDHDGTKARKILRRLVVDTVDTGEELGKWNAAIVDL